MLQLQSPAGTSPVAFGGGYFCAQLPGTSATAHQLPDGGPFTLIAYNSAGNQVASINLNELPAKFQHP